MPQSHPAITAGMQVVGPHLDYIGNVQEVRDRDFLVNRTHDADIYVPFDAVSSVRKGQVVLTVSADDIELKNWPHPASVGAISGGLPAAPGPAGGSMPVGEPGYPTFEGTGQDEPLEGAQNLTSEQDAGELGQPPPATSGLETLGEALRDDVEQEERGGTE